MNFFSRYFRPSFAAIFALACFGTGVMGAHTAFAIDKQVALHHARTAAAELTERQEELEESLERASDATAAAKEIADEEPVVQAAQDVDAATTKAKAAVATAPVARDADEAAEADAAPVVDIPSTDASDDATPAAVDATTDNDDTVASPTFSAQPSTVAEDSTPSPGEDSVDSDAPAATDQEASADDTSADNPDPAAAESIEKVLEGNIDDPDEAREAKEHLDSALADLEEAAAEVDTSVAKLEETTRTVEHERSLDEADGFSDDVASLNARVNAVLPSLTSQVADPDTLVTALDAHAHLQEVTVADFDRDDADEVATYITTVTEARTAFDEAASAVRQSHEEWVENENARIDEANDEALEGYEETYDDTWAGWTAANRAQVSSHQGGWTGQPTGVSGSNGNVSESSLCGIDFAPGHVLQCDAAAALEAADAEYYRQTGSHLSFTDSYRTYGSQVATRASKGYMAAVPGTSNHGWGMAVDFDRASATWMAANGADFGWVHPTWARSGGSKPEWWHLEYVAPTVGEFEAPKKPATEDHVESVFATLDDEEDDEQAADDADKEEK